MRQKRTRKPRYVAVKAAILTRNGSVALRFRAGHTNRNWTGRMRWGFAPNPTRVGAPPWTRRRRMLRDVDHQQLAAVAWMTQFTASGQASEVGPAVRKAHSEKPPDSQKMNTFNFWPVRRFFFCPEAFFATLKLQAQIVCERSQARSPGAFFAAFFLRKKARNPLFQFLFVCFETGNRISLPQTYGPPCRRPGFYFLTSAVKCCIIL